MVFKNKDIQYHFFETIIEDCRYLLNVNKASNKHIWREANQCTDFLTNEGHKHDEDLII